MKGILSWMMGAWLSGAMILGSPEAAAAPSPSPGKDDVGITQRLGATIPDDLVLRDERGRPTRLGELLPGKPVVLVPVYFSCPNLCNMTLEGFINGANAADLAVGRDVAVAVVSIDPGDTPHEASRRKATTVNKSNHPDKAGWRFLTGDAAAIARLTGAVGFRYAYDATSRQYAHPSAAMVLTPRGTVARYLFGLEFPARDLRLAVLEAGEGKVGTVVDRILLTCFRYDPRHGRYGARIMGVLRLLGASTIVAMAVLVVGLRRRETAGPVAGKPWGKPGPGDGDEGEP